MRPMSLAPSKLPGGKQAGTPNDTAARVSQSVIDPGRKSDRLAVQAVSKPAYLRLPRSGERCPYSGMSRSQLWNQIKSGEIKSISLQRRGTCRGTRLIVVSSLDAWLAKQVPAEVQEAQLGQEGGKP